MAKYFGTNGIRGLFTELTPGLAMKAAQAFGIWCKKGKVLVGRDARITGECLLNAVKSGLASVGCEVVDLGICSAPAAEYMLGNAQQRVARQGERMNRKQKADGLIIITASHNTPEWNALKFVDGKGVTISRERGEEIEKLMENPKLAEWNKVREMHEIKNATEEHIKEIEKNVDLEKIRNAKMKIALDFGNGTSALYSKMFENVAETIVINENIDGHFPGRPSEPSEKNIGKLIELVKKTECDAGFAWDGDADRFVMVDEKGNFIIGDRVFALSVLIRLKGKKGGKIVTTVATSKAAEDVASKFGAKTIYTKVGAPYLSEAMMKEQVEIAGEEVGGVIWKEISLAKDGLITAMKMLEAIAEKPLSEWMKEIPVYFNAKVKIEVRAEEKLGLIGKFAELVKDKKPVLLDG
ncbi:hypothetical protein KJ780_02175, partial [Candidatus Micrarchaeota archaeon]|nr:hypothetical protein [Candidatus Micrarchaeota archaeon]